MLNNLIFNSTRFIQYSLLILLTIITRFGNAQTETEEFELVKKDPPVFVYERWITFPGKTPEVKAREVKGEFLINSSMYKIISIIKDESSISQWQKHVSDFDVHLEPDSTSWLEYSYHDLPWPVSDQDHFLRYELTEKIPGKEIFITFESTENNKLAPVKNSVTRLELAGSWHLEQVSPNQVRATYRILSMPGDIPRVFTDPIIRSNLMSTIKALTKMAEKNYN